MKTARNCLCAAFLASFAFVTAGCNSDSTTTTGPAGDTSKAYQSSDEAARDMAKNAALPAKK